MKIVEETGPSVNPNVYAFALCKGFTTKSHQIKNIQLFSNSWFQQFYFTILVDSRKRLSQTNLATACTHSNGSIYAIVRNAKKKKNKVIGLHEFDSLDR